LAVNKALLDRVTPFLQKDYNKSDVKITPLIDASETEQAYAADNHVDA
jgi:hypothetical protein